MKRQILITAVVLSGIIPATFLIAGQGTPKLRDRNNVPKCKAQVSERTSTSTGTGFDSDNVQLMSWLSLSDFGNPNNASDCWGYTSPSGREYALLGLRTSMVVVEITNPSSPSIIGYVSHSSSLWADVKVYQDVAYVSNENGGGIDVIDLSQVDSGIVTLSQRMTTGGVSSSHNLVVDEQSGFLYLAGGSINGGRLVAYDLSNPLIPVIKGQMNSGSGLHDAHVVTYTSGPYSGRQICFGAAGGTGLYVIDVTDKSNMFQMSHTTYGGLSYCHQCWTTEDLQYLYVNDETDGIALTRVFDISNLSNPVLVNTFGWGENSIDHNLYVIGNRLYEANYTSGVRIFDLSSDPVNPTLIGYFDTHPESNGQSYNGLWSVFPYFPSGTVIGSDIERGLFVWDISQLDPCSLPIGSCADDIDGDGIVGVGDVLAIINDWGICGDGSFRPAGDVDGDCCVGIADLLQVIAAWGTECVPTGSCCYIDGTCLETTEEACNQASGNYSGDDTTCDDTNCPGAGDDCNSAMIASLGANSYETITATPSSPEPNDGLCSGTWMNWNNSQDIWFKWIAEFSGSTHFTTCDPSSYDTSMALYVGSCSNQVTCNGDASGEAGCQAYYSAFDWNVTEGETYYIRIGGWEGATGTGTLTIE